MKSIKLSNGDVALASGRRIKSSRLAAMAKALGLSVAAFAAIVSATTADLSSASNGDIKGSELTAAMALNFDMPLGRDLGVGNNPSGLICAANEARFESTHYSKGLSGYTVGWRDPENIDTILDELLPSIPSGRRIEFKRATNSEQFLSEADDLRAINAMFKRVEMQGDTVLSKTLNKGLTVRVDHDEIDESDGDWQQMYVAWLTQRLLRNDLRRGISIVDAASTNVAKVWGAGSNPDGDLRGMLTLGANATGMRPNQVAIGEAAWDLRLDVYEPANTPYASRAAGMTQEDLARKLLVDRVSIVKARYQSSASAKTAIVPSVAYSYLAYPGAMKNDPTNVKRFLSKARNGLRFGVYITPYEKFTDISVEHYSNILAATTLGIRKITLTAS